MLKENEKNDQVNEDKSFEIEEWSDEDEAIRQRNQQNKLKKQAMTKKVDEIYSEFKDYDASKSSLNDDGKHLIYRFKALINLTFNFKCK